MSRLQVATPRWQNMTMAMTGPKLTLERFSARSSLGNVPGIVSDDPVTNRGAIANLQNARSRPSFRNIFRRWSFRLRPLRCFYPKYGREDYAYHFLRSDQVRAPGNRWVWRLCAGKARANSPILDRSSRSAPEHIYFAQSYIYAAARSSARTLHGTGSST